MAELAVALLPFAVERLWNLLVRETERFQGVEEQFKGLKNDVKTLRCFLKDAEAKKHSSEMVKKVIKDIKEIVFDAEDIIETFLLKKELGESSSSSVKRFAYVKVKSMVLGFDMKPISKRISKVILDMQNLDVQKFIVNEEDMQSLLVKEREMRQTFPTSDEDHLVGLERSVERLVGYLVEEDSSQVVSITGMGGLGKTTLARQVYNHETIKSHFPKGLVWVCVSQQFERKCVWQTILRQLWPECDVSKMMEQELREKIVRVLETKKALIVIDDIWREGDWDLIKDVFLPRKGWKVLITSRNEEVALHADKQCVTFKPECLTFEDSWDLFQRIAFPIKDTTEFKIEKDMKEIGMEIIRHCGGLPLAIKVLGALLGNKYTLHEWKRVRENIKAPTLRGSGSDDRNFNLKVYCVLYQSFEELPAYLKQCFLYLACFPEDSKIDVEKLSYYWAAEGILMSMDFDGASIREVADGYIQELVKRNMVISKRDVDNSRFETLQLHDMMREVCLRKAEEENFVETIDTSTENSKSPCKSRRLAVVPWPGETFSVDKEVKNPSLRTLLFLERKTLMATSLLFTRHKLMRVLDLPSVEFKGGFKVPSSIGKLIHLRYLSLVASDVTQLPSSMRNLKKLIYLNLYICWPNSVYMPNILNEMRELTFLCLPKSLHDKTKLELGNLVKLETLKNFSTKHGRLTDLQGMTRLRYLCIFITDERYTIETLSSSLSKLSHLESLTIYNDNKFYTPTNDDEEGFVWDFVNLKELKLEIYMPKLPDAQRFPSHLTTISLKQSRLKKDPMPILEKLIHLKEICLGGTSFCGRRMACSRDGFPQLQKLEFWGLEEWEEWIVEQGSMPLLHTLEIKNCRKLKELPDGLRFITNLEDLSVKYMGDEFNLRLSEGYLPSHLTTICLSGCHLTEDPMPILEKLLQLKEISLHEGSFCGRRIVCSRDGFPQLQKLLFWGLKEWEEWIIEEGSMPVLHTLSIQNCRKLKELPDGLRFITSLNDLTVGDSSIRLSETCLPSFLTTISLVGLTEDQMMILEKLLHLKVVSLCTSICGRRMVCSRDGFPQLQYLQFYGLEEWEEWIIEEGSMPLLHTLDIQNCRKLKEIPDGLRFITSLKCLTCYGMAEAWEKRLSEGGEDYYKVQHIPSVKLCCY
ncbi:probable disease resistance protein At1g59620 isoform X2 [Brassica napus]|uniref:probable disease resistance protein At1g59620 isoform X2 n=1 Tax=Brassica napus TaxID=3708 RepID=UPI002078AD80|nr:probable disease resistance protein At1g59620 isoform X2 [Brassica napus]XP_048604305.1 probable disease resistance protein At1g59620 isoform X2 [Brassica napus]